MASPGNRRRLPSGLLPPAYALALALAVTAPLLAPGYLLLRDAVSTPRSYLTDAALGLAEGAPRAVPQDFLLAAASSVVDGGVLVKALTIAGLWLAGWGAARLAAFVVPDGGLGGQFVAATVAVWNPYVAERLLQGHWSLLVGYGCLPWVAAAVLRSRWWSLLFWTALAGLTPTGLMLAATVALVCAVVDDGRLCRAAISLGMSLLVAVPWLVAALLGSGLLGGTGVSAFAARAEPGLGTLGSLAALGGIWNAGAVPSSRTTLFALVGAVVLLGIVAMGLPALRRRPAAVALCALAAAAVLVPALMATPPGLAVVDAAVRALPGLGVVRDGQKWVALAMPGYALAGAGAVVTLRRPVPAAVVCCAALIAVLPDLAWGVGGEVVAREYPAGWQAVASAIGADPRPVAVLPADSIRVFDWTGSAPVLDPLPRWVRAPVLTTGDLVISSRLVDGEGSGAREVQRLLLDGAPPARLADAGVGWVVVEKSPGALGSSARTLASLPVVYRDSQLTLYRVGGDMPPAAGRAVMIGAHCVWLAALLAGAVGSAVRAGRARAARRAPTPAP